MTDLCLMPLVPYYHKSYLFAFILISFFFENFFFNHDKIFSQTAHFLFINRIDERAEMVKITYDVIQTAISSAIFFHSYK